MPPTNSGSTPWRDHNGCWLDRGQSDATPDDVPTAHELARDLGRHRPGRITELHGPVDVEADEDAERLLDDSLTARRAISLCAGRLAAVRSCLAHAVERTRASSGPSRCVGEHRHRAADAELGGVLECFHPGVHRTDVGHGAGEEPAGEERGDDREDHAERRGHVDAVDERGLRRGGERRAPRGGGSFSATCSAPAIDELAVPRAAAGICSSASWRWLEYCDAAMLPSTATPSAAPSSRVASFIAEPAPARRVGHGRHDRRGHRRHRQRDAGHERDQAQQHVPVRRVRWSSCVNSKNPSAISAHAERRPCGCAPKRRSSRGVSGATTIMIGAIGSSRSAAPRADVAEHELEVLRDEEHHAVHRQEHEDHAAGAGAERRVAEVAHVEHRLVGVAAPTARRARARRSRSRTRPSVAGADPALVGRLDEPVHERRRCRRSRARRRAGRVAPRSGSRDFGTRNQPPTRASAMIGTLTRNTEPNQKWPSSQPLIDRADRAGGAGDARPRSRSPWRARRAGRR